MTVSVPRHRALVYSLVALGLALMCAAAATPASAALPTAGGIYKGHVKGGNARLTVAPDARTLGLEISYKEICRFGDDRPFRSRTGVSVGARINASGRFRKSQQLDGPHVRFSGRFRRDGRRVVGRFRATVTSISGEHCKARFPFRLRRVDIGKALQPSDAGSYVGTTDQGRRLSFTLAYDRQPPGGTFALRDVHFTATVRCYDPHDVDAGYRNLTVSLGGITGTVPNDGVIARALKTPSGSPAPLALDAGRFLLGSAKGRINIDPLYADADGTPASDGQYSCWRLADRDDIGPDNYMRFTATRR